MAYRSWLDQLARQKRVGDLVRISCLTVDALFDAAFEFLLE